MSTSPQRWRISMTALAAVALAAISAHPMASAKEEDACGLVAEQPNVYQLCGTTVISGSNSGSVEVIVPKSIPFDATNEAGDLPKYDSFDVEVADSGFGGFALVKHAQLSPIDPWYRPWVVGMRVPAAMGWGEQYREVNSTYDSYFHGSLDPGRYTLYLLAEPGSSTEVTLHLPGLCGSIALSPEKPSKLEVRRFDSRVPSPDSRHFFVGGSDGDVRYGGLSWVGVAATGDFPRSGSASVCAYARGAVREEFYSSPACVPLVGGWGGGGGPIHPSLIVFTGNDNFERWSLSGPAPEGKTGLGAFYSSAGLTNSMMALGVWISFN